MIADATRSARPARLLDVPRDHGDVRDVDVRGRGVRGGQQGLPPPASAKERKSSYAAAEAGLGYYLKQLRRTRTPGRSATGRRLRTRPRTARSTSSGTARQRHAHAGASSRARRPVHDRAAAHRELHAVRHRPSRSRSSTSPRGTFKVRVSGRSIARRSTPQRSIVATFMRDGFLRFIWFTDQENRDPQAESERRRRAPPAGQLRRPQPHRARRARAASRSSSPAATRSTARCTPTTRAC